MSKSAFVCCLTVGLTAFIFPEVVLGQRGGLDVAIPGVAVSSVGENRQIWIREVTDARAYQERPRTPEIPSMGRGLSRTTPEERAKAIGRARDGYGRARHNVFLARNKTVDQFVTELLQDTLTKLGYRVVLDGTALEDDALILDAHVNKFWSWVNVDSAGAWTGSSSPMRLEGEMETRINIQDGNNTRQLITAGRSSHRIFAGLTRGNWLKTYELFLTDYIQNLHSALQQTQR